MTTLADIGLAATFNIISALVFLIAFAFLRLQPINDRVYFPKWYIKGLRCSPSRSSSVRKIVNLDWRSYIRIFNWVPDALKMPEPELIEHAGLDSVVYLRIYLLGLKVFVPMTLIAWAIIVPVNWTNNTLATLDKLVYSNIDKLSISNVPYGSPRFWTHIVMAYVFTFWTCYALRNEYETIVAMRLHFLASARRRPDQFTVLVRNVPPDYDESVTECVEHFFLVNHPDTYLTHQVVINANKLAKLVKEKKKKQNWLDYYQLKYLRKRPVRPKMKLGFLGLWGEKVDAIEHETAEIERLSKEIDEERERVATDPKCIMPAAFVSFKSRWGAVVGAQTQQSRNPTSWLTEWAPEPRDVYWDNLAIPYVSLTVRRLITTVAFVFLTIFFMIPVTAVQSIANIEGLERKAPWLKPITQQPLIKSFIQGVLPGLALKIFLLVLPMVLMIMSKFEGLISISSLERRSVMRHYIFNFINVFLVSVIAGSAMQQLDSFLKKDSLSGILIKLGIAIPMKANFFITYIMVDGWAIVAGEILRLLPLILYHVTNSLFVKTEKDREEAMDPGSIAFNIGEPRIQFYFLLGFVYAIVTPVFLPFILVFFALAFVVFRHQIINVYNQKYESAGAFWPEVHARIIYSLVFSQLVLMGLMGTKGIVQAPPILIVLPIMTIFFHWLCKNRYGPAFVNYPLQEAMMKDTLERAREPNLDLKGYLQKAYIHPVFKDKNEDDDEDEGFNISLDDIVIVPTKRQSRGNTPVPSKFSGASSPSPSLPDVHENYQV